MTEKNFLQKTMLHMAAVLILLTLCLFSGIVPGINAHAETTSQSEIANLPFTLTSTDGSAVSTKANPNETTVLIFGYIGCGKTRSTLNSISSCGWVKRSDIRVIFAETYMNSQEEVQNYKDGYNCEEMIFCYNDESDIHLRVMAAYGNLFGMSGGSYPVVVIIDKNDKIQHFQTGTMTADEILSEIKKFENIDESGTNTPPSGDDSGIENYAYALTTIENTTVSTKANPNETTVLIFGYTTCGNTKATLQDIDKSSWVSRSDIRVIYAESYGASLTETKEFAENYSSGDIIFCHDEDSLNYNRALYYLKLYNYTGGTFPYIVLIDQNNKIQSITLGPKTADEILAEIEKFTKNEPESPDGSNTEKPDGSTTEKPDGSASDKNPPVTEISDVTGLKAVSAAKNVKLSWNKVSNASGYIVYQYNNSKKAWVKKTTLNNAATSCTIKGLTAGTTYRFAVKAYLQMSDKEQIISKSYTSLYTATAPSAVNFKVKAGKNNVNITWKKVKGATGYTVYYKTKAKGAWKKLKNTKGTSFKKAKLKSGATYYFTVKAYKTYKKTTYTSNFSSKKVVIK